MEVKLPGAAPVRYDAVTYVGFYRPSDRRRTDNGREWGEYNLPGVQTVVFDVAGPTGFGYDDALRLELQHR